MDIYSNKQKWKSTQLQKIQNYVDSNRNTEEFSPTLYVRLTQSSEYEAWGIKDYKAADIGLKRYENIDSWNLSRTGTLELPFPNNKILRVEKVHCVIIFWGKEHASWGYNLSTPMLRGITSIAPDLEEMEELHFAIQTVDFNPNDNTCTSDILFFKGSSLLTKVKNVSAIGDHHYGNIYYAKKKKGVYTHYIRDIDNNVHIIGKSKQAKLNCEIHRYEAIRKIVTETVNKAIEDGTYRFYYYSNPSTQGTVLESYLTRHCTPIKIDNYFSDDETCNYYVDIDINDTNLIVFLKYYGSSSFAIYGIELDNYLPYLPYESEDNWYYNSVSQMVFHRKVLSNALETNCDETENALMLSLEKLRGRSTAVQDQVQFELFRRLLPDAKEYHNPYYDWVKKEYRAEKDYLLANDRLNCIWKGEFQMYKMAKELYPDAQYQYHSDWLGRQSLDVYIPSISVGIEYQGIQHYEPVDHFGGKDAYLYRVELDIQKRQLCASNNVKLLEWRYDSPLTKNALSKQIKHLLR